MTMMVGPSKINEVETILRKRFCKGRANNPQAVTFLISKNIKIEGQDWVTYCISNFQEKTLQRIVAEIIDIPQRDVDVFYGKDKKGFGNMISITIM